MVFLAHSRTACAPRARCTAAALLAACALPALPPPLPACTTCHAFAACRCLCTAPAALPRKKSGTSLPRWIGFSTHDGVLALHLAITCADIIACAVCAYAALPFLQKKPFVNGRIGLAVADGASADGANGGTRAPQERASLKRICVQWCRITHASGGRDPRDRLFAHSRSSHLIVGMDVWRRAVTMVHYGAGLLVAWRILMVKGVAGDLLSRLLHIFRSHAAP